MHEECHSKCHARAHRYQSRCRTAISFVPFPYSIPHVRLPISVCPRILICHQSKTYRSHLTFFYRNWKLSKTPTSVMLHLEVQLTLTLGVVHRNNQPITSSKRPFLDGSNDASTTVNEAKLILQSFCNGCLKQRVFGTSRTLSMCIFTEGTIVLFAD